MPVGMPMPVAVSVAVSMTVPMALVAKRPLGRMVVAQNLARSRFISPSGLDEEAHGRHGFWDRLPSLVPPALFVWGDRDRLVPSTFAAHVADALPDAASIVMEDCGHVPQFEHPEETMAIVRGFLAGIEG